MKTLFLELNMGVAGDMLFASLLELLENQDEFIKRFNNIGLENVIVLKEEIIKSGIKGTQIIIKINNHEEENHHHEEENHHHHSDMKYIEDIINNLKISEDVKKNALEVYKIIAEAESTVHNKPVTKIHFHEVGMLDAIGDIVGVCMLLEEIKPEKILATPVHVGYGFVNCAHGILPVPAPATSLILRNIPIYSGKIEGELCTPTGAALIKHFVEDFGEMPVIKINKIGYGMGKKEFEVVNCVRAFLGETENKKKVV